MGVQLCVHASMVSSLGNEYSRRRTVETTNQLQRLFLEVAGLASGSSSRCLLLAFDINQLEFWILATS
jgi:hypothetical protein